MFSPLPIIISLSLYVGLLFLIALWVERGSLRARRLANSPLVYALALAVYCTSWTYYGSVGNAAASGTLFLTIYLGPTIIIALWWIVLRKLVRIKATHRITSIADFISARYERSVALAAIATVIALIGITPYVALQLKAVTSSFILFAAPGGTAETWSGGPMGLIVVGVMTVFTIIFGARRLDPTERHKGMIVALAVQCVVKLAAFLAVGIFVTYFMYGGFGDILQRLSESPYQGLMNVAGEDTSAYLTWMTYLVLAMSAIMFLPRQFHVAVVENSNEKHIRTAMWFLPLYLFLINIFVVPIAVGGLLQGHSIQEADTFVIALPLEHGQPWLAMLAFIGGFSAATGMVMVSAMTMATMLVNHLLVPLIEWTEGLGFLRRYLLRARWVAIGVVLIIGYLVERLIGASYTLVNMGLISFAAALQFAPAILGGLFWRQGNKRGAMLGLGAGFLTWAYTLFIPSLAKSGWLPMSFLENGPWGIGFLRPEQLFGLTELPPLTHTLFWTMVVNVGLYVLGSLYFEQSEEEKELAEAFVDALAVGAGAWSAFYGEARVQLAGKKGMLHNLMCQYFSDARAEHVLESCMEATKLHERDLVSVAELAELYGEVERALAGSIGAAAAHRALNRDVLFTPEEARELSGIYSRILTDLRVSPEELKSRIDYYQEREQLLTSQAVELEQMVAERTRGLQAATEVGRAAASILEPSELIQQAVDLIRRRFDLYYVGLFLLDEAHEWAVLEAGTGEAGQIMLARGHQIKIGEGMVGWSIAHAKPRVALEAGEDAVRLATTELPDTRSEAALPLRSRGRAIGALTVQSDRVGSFDEATIAVLQTMADQVAVALDNAWLFAEAEEALEAERHAYGEISRQAWQELVHGQQDLGFLSDERGTVPAGDLWELQMERAVQTGEVMLGSTDSETGISVAIPIKVRDRVIGVIDGRKSDGTGEWTPEDVELLERLTDQLAQALESARLYQDTQRRAAREQTLGEIASRVRETLDVDTVLQTAAREIRERLELPEVVIRLAPGEDGD